MRAETLAREVVRALDEVVIVVADFRIADAAEDWCAPCAAEVQVVRPGAESEVARIVGVLGDVIATASLEHELAGRVRSLDEEVARDNAVVVRRDHLTGKLAAIDVEGVRVPAAKRAVRRLVDRVVEIRTHDAVARGDLSGQLAFVALVELDGRRTRDRNVAPAAIDEESGDVALEVAAGAEEPQPVANDASADGGFVRLVERAVRTGFTAIRGVGPGRIGERVAEASRELISTRLGDC